MKAYSHIRRALPEDAQLLTDLTLTSKAYWGYTQEFLDASRSSLTVTSDYIKKSEAFVFDQEKVLGFYAFTIKDTYAYLDYLFISPDAIRGGIGKALWNHVVKTARNHKCKEILIDSDPYAEGFYLAMGAVKIGEVPSSAIPNRFLPLLKFTL